MNPITWQPISLDDFELPANENNSQASRVLLEAALDLAFRDLGPGETSELILTWLARNRRQAGN
jgi:hypothetical protein